jgi:Na+-translocating ferredoxin:NAD+ oxidoreductase RnfD subunit
MTTRAVTIAGRRYPVVLPKLNDARLHTAGVVMTVHVLGQVTLGFAVSVPQILVAIVTSALIEVGITAVRQHRLQWPASAMLTGSGVALIMRVSGTEAGDHWSFHRWWLFSIVAGGSLLTKYLIRWRGSHLFNPSNIGLVAAFVLLGSNRVEPLELWWARPSIGMTIAYVVIGGGGLLIIGRLRLLPLAAAFWCTLMAGLAVLAGSGHCIVTPSRLRPVCDGSFWWLFATSPEILIFLFFMITDPRTVPLSRRGRVAFGVAVGALAALMIAPHSTEFRAKVGLLAALTIVTASRPLVARVSSLRSRLDSLVRAISRRTSVAGGEVSGVAVGLAIPVVALLFVMGIVAVGEPARLAVAAPVKAEALPRLSAILDWPSPPTLPALSSDPDITIFGPEYASAAKQEELCLALLRALAVEAELLRRRDPDLLRAVDHGTRLDELTDLINGADSGAIDVPEYVFDTMRLVPVRRGRQSGAVVGVEAHGTVRRIQTDSTGAAQADTIEPVALVAALRRAIDGRWLIVDLRPAITDHIS